MTPTFIYRIDPLESGGFVAYCPAMKPVRVYGETKDDAHTKIKSTAKLFLKRHPDYLENVHTYSLEE